MQLVIRYPPPLLIFPRVHFKERMLFGGPVGCIGTANQSGWSNEESFIMFLDHFLNAVKSSKDDRVMLILDNHETHLSPAVLDKVSDAGIVMVTFPPHTSHRLQPLDLSVYGPLKTYYNQVIEAWLLNNKGKAFDIYSVAEALGTAYPRAFTPKNILSGFRTSGIFPFNEAVFNDDDYLCSYMTDRSLNTSEPGPSTTSDLVSSSSVIPGPSTSAALISCSSSNAGPSTSSTFASCSSPVPGPSSDLGAFISSAPDLFATPNTNKEKIKTFLTPEEVQPYSKAQGRKKKKGGRKPGRTMIATDTPEKNAIKERKSKKEKYKKAVEKIKKISKDVVKSFNQSDEKKKQRNYRKKQLKKIKLTKQASSSSSGSEVLSLVSTDDEDSGDEEVCLYCGSSKFSDKSGEEWCKCTYCGRWVHFLCAGVEGDEWKHYLCDYCKDKLKK